MNLDPSRLAQHVNNGNEFDFPFGYEWVLPKIYGHQITRFMVLELAVAILMMLIFVPLARKLATGIRPRGDSGTCSRRSCCSSATDGSPGVGRHDADRLLPFILTLFFFILFCNLMGLVPCLGSPTASISVTGPLAVDDVPGRHRHRHEEDGLVRFWTGLCPPMEISVGLKIMLVPMIWCWRSSAW